ncbi:MAG TPA: heme-binding protein [bacterium]|nr:heme-binding protein [bacterium]
MKPGLLPGALLGTLLLLPGCAIVRTTVSKTPEPAFTVERHSGAVEIRRYDSLVVAETTVATTDSGAASNEGFRRLFRYITGANRGAKKIEMTAPVIVAPERGEEIAMTAPVGLARAADGWTVSFVLPASFTLENAPQPTDARITLREIPARRVAALRFSGFTSASRVAREQARTREILAKDGLEASGDPVLARYDPPWIPPFWRRNEILVEVAE